MQNSVEHNLDRRRHAASAAYGATTPRRMAMRHGGGRGAEEKVRGAEPSGGFAARRRKRAGRGYMLPFARVEHGLPLRQRTLPPMPEQRNTSRTEPSTLFCSRALAGALLQNRAGARPCAPHCAMHGPASLPPASTIRRLWARVTQKCPVFCGHHIHMPGPPEPAVPCPPLFPPAAPLFCSVLSLFFFLRCFRAPRPRTGRSFRVTGRRKLCAKDRRRRFRLPARRA